MSGVPPGATLGLRARLRATRLVRRYPATTTNVSALASIALLFGLTLLWRWTFVVYAAVVVGWILVAGVRRDRRRSGERDA